MSNGERKEGKRRVATIVIGSLPYIYARVQVFNPFHSREHDGLVVPLGAVFLGQEVHLPLLLLPVQQGWGLGTEVMKLGKVIRIHC